MAFVDAGSAYLTTLPNFSQFAPRVGTGVGVRYYTGFGPARLDFGIPLNQADGTRRSGFTSASGRRSDALRFASLPGLPAAWWSVPVLAFAGLQTGLGQRALASAVSSKDAADLRARAASSPPTCASPRPSSRIVTAHGSLEDARLSWSFASLFSGRVRIDEVTARRIEVLRPPAPSDAKSASGGGGINLPLGVDLRALSVDDLHVGATLGGVNSHWKLGGAALLAADGTQSHLKLDMTRSDGPTAHLSVYADSRSTRSMSTARCSPRNRPGAAWSPR